MSSASVLKQLFPVELGSISDSDFDIEGSYLDVLLSSADDLLAEVFPDTATDLLFDWERVYGIYSAPGASTADRRNAIIARARDDGGLHKDYFIGIAAGLGYSITITDGGGAFRAGISSAGEALGVESDYYSWIVDVSGVASASDLEQLITDLRPAHTAVSFTYNP